MSAENCTTMLYDRVKHFWRGFTCGLVMGFCTGVVLLMLLLPLSAYAGGAEYEAPIQKGRCNPITVPEDLIGEGWKWVRAHERMKIAKGDNEITPFQMMYCIEFTSTGGTAREYVIAMEWWRPKLRRKHSGTGGH